MEVYVISKHGYCMGVKHEVIGVFQHKIEIYIEKMEVK